MHENFVDWGSDKFWKQTWDLEGHWTGWELIVKDASGRYNTVRTAPCGPRPSLEN